MDSKPNFSEFWKTWDKTGKQAFISDCKKILTDIKRMADNDEDTYDKENFFGRCIYELLKQGCKGLMKKDKVISVLHSLVGQPPAASIIADAFAIVDNETSAQLCPEGLRESFVAMVVAANPFLGYLFMERFDAESVIEGGSFYSKSAFNTRFIRLKTKMYYKQQKFNLLREESEGFAKLISELSEPSASKSVTYTSQVLHCLIGHFNLDPNRVIDIVLESFESQPNSEFFIPLLETLKPSPATICELIGFKLTNFDAAPKESLFTLIALLLQHNVFTIEDIYPWLTPNDRIIQKQWDREIAEAKEYARRSMIVTINKEVAEDTDVITSPEDRYPDNQKFLLCEALLSIGAMDHALNLMERLPEYSCVSNKRISTRLIQLLHYILDPIYREHSNLSTKLGVKLVVTYGSSDKVHPQIFNFDDLLKHINAILAIGPYIYHDPVLLYKILRIMKSYLQKIKSQRPTPLYFKFITMLDEVVLPCLCFLDANCSVSEEIWSVIKFYPYHHRFRLYASWKGDSVVLMHPVLLKKRVDLVKRVKHLMRRISKENVKLMGRLLGKLSHSMPAVVFDYILSQIQLFDNLIMPVIDALKFLTLLSYDILVFCLLEALSPCTTSNADSLSVMLMPNRPRTKHDGSTIAPWIQSLSSFAGAICKKYSIELVPLLQFIANQLKNKQSLDLLLLKEIVQKMTGIEAAEEMTSEQLDAMAGGELLRGEAGYFGQVRTAKKSAARLREAASMNDLAVSLCVLMAQQRNCIIYDESQSLHIKLVGKLYDQCQDTLVQFGTFLATSCTLDDYAKKIPPLQNLVEDYHTSPDVAFFLWRPLFAHSVSTKYDELRRAEKSHKNLTVAQRQQKYAQASHIILNPVIETMRNFLPAKTWEDISPQFYVTFWSLTLYDLHVPTEAYAREISRVKQVSAAAVDNKDLASSKRKKEQERCNALIEKLQEEERRQTEHVDRVMAKLNQEKDSWFASRAAKSAKNEAVTAFLQFCLFPRCIFTAPDALYCAHFVNTIHSLSTPNFSTLICYDRILCDIMYTVTSCSENEANRYGRFLCALLGTVMKWHSDKSIFDKECSKFPGFVTKFRAANASSTESSDHVDYENFRHVCHKWHYKITKSVIVCLESKDFIQIRNSLIVLKRILPYYPKVSNLAHAVERFIERVRADEKDNRQDLFALATSYIGQLKSRSTSFVAEEDFHQKAEKVEKASPEKTNVKKSVSVKDEKSVVPVKDSKKKTAVRVENHVTSTPSAPTSNSVKVANGSSSTNSVPKSTSVPSSSHSTTSKSKTELDKEKEKEKDKEKDKEKEKEKDKSRERNSTRDRRRERNNEERSSKKSSEKNSDSTSTDVKDKSSSSQSGRRDSIDGTSSSSRRSLDSGEASRETKRRKVDNQISKTSSSKFSSRLILSKTRKIDSCVRELFDNKGRQRSRESSSNDTSSKNCNSNLVKEAFEPIVQILRDPGDSNVEVTKSGHSSLSPLTRSIQRLVTQCSNQSLGTLSQKESKSSKVVVEDNFKVPLTPLSVISSETIRNPEVGTPIPTPETQWEGSIFRRNVSLSAGSLSLQSSSQHQESTCRDLDKYLEKQRLLQSQRTWQENSKTPKVQKKGISKQTDLTTQTPTKPKKRNLKATELTTQSPTKPKKRNLRTTEITTQNTKKNTI